jgi:hypothetical protein
VTVTSGTTASATRTDATSTHTAWETRGNKIFLGPGLKVNTSWKFTVVAQFIADNNSTSGTLTEIRRLYVQNSKVFTFC